MKLFTLHFSKPGKTESHKRFVWNAQYFAAGTARPVSRPMIALLKPEPNTRWPYEELENALSGAKLNTWSYPPPGQEYFDPFVKPAAEISAFLISFAFVIPDMISYAIYTKNSRISPPPGTASISKLYLSIYSTPQDTTTSSNQLFISLVSTRNISQKLCSLDEHKRLDLDGISPNVFKMCIPELTLLLCHFSYLSFHISTFPIPWKHDDIRPISKRGNLSDPNKYCPISLTFIISKVLEPTLSNQLWLILERKGLLSDRQHEFRQYRSIEEEQALAYVYVWGRHDRTWVYPNLKVIG